MLMQQELGNEPSEEDSVMAILRTFYSDDKRQWTECILEFNSLIVQEYTGRLRLSLDFENKPAEYFIVADTYLSLANLTELYNHLTSKKEKDISVSLAMKVKNEFLKSVSHFKEKYEWIYNMPILPGVNKHSIGRDLRNEFQSYYGPYNEITYVLACGNALKFDEVNSMLLKNYLALGEYLLRKRAIESIT